MSITELISILPVDVLIRNSAESGSVELFEYVIKFITKSNIINKSNTSESKDINEILNSHIRYILPNINKIKVLFKYFDAEVLVSQILNNLPHEYHYNESYNLRSNKQLCNPSLEYVLDIINEKHIVLEYNHINYIMKFDFITDSNLYSHISRLIMNTKEVKYLSCCINYHTLIKLRFIKCIKLLLVWKIYPNYPVELIKLLIEMKLSNLAIEVIRNLFNKGNYNDVVEYVMDLEDTSYINYIVENYEMNSEQLYIKFLIDENSKKIKCKKSHLLDKIMKKLVNIDRSKAQRVFRKYINRKNLVEYDFMIVRSALSLGVDDIALKYGRKSVNDTYYEFISGGRLDLFEIIVSGSYGINRDYDENYWYYKLITEYESKEYKDRRMISIPVWDIIFKVYPPEEVKLEFRVCQSSLYSQSLYEALMERRYKVPFDIMTKYVNSLHRDKLLYLVGLCDEGFNLRKCIYDSYPRLSAEDIQLFIIRLMFWYPELQLEDYGLESNEKINTIISTIRSELNIYFSPSITKIICMYY